MICPIGELNSEFDGPWFGPTESSSAADSTTISSGKHKIEAKDASGKVIDSQTVEFDG